MDAERGSSLVVARMEAGDRLLEQPLGQLQRAHDSESACDRFPNALDSRGLVVRVEARVDDIRGLQVRDWRSAVHSSVLARMGRLSTTARGPAAERGLPQEFGERYACSSRVLRRAFARLSRLL